MAQQLTVLSALSETLSLVLNNYIKQLISCNSSVIISNGMFWTLLAPHACKEMHILNQIHINI